MRVFLGADHRGFELKEKIKSQLLEDGYEVVDVGAKLYDKDDDFVDYARSAVEQLTAKEDRAVLFCGSGHGMEIVANRFEHVRAVLGFNLEVTVQGRAHENANVLSVPAEWVTDEQASRIVENFLNTPFSGKDRYERRLRKLHQIES